MSATLFELPDFEELGEDSAVAGSATTEQGAADEAVAEESGPLPEQDAGEDLPSSQASSAQVQHDHTQPPPVESEEWQRAVNQRLCPCG